MGFLYQTEYFSPVLLIFLEFDQSTSTIEFKNTLYTAGNGINIDAVTREIKNTGIVLANDTFFEKTDDGSGKKISLTGALIGNTAGKIIGSPGKFLKCTKYRYIYF